MSQVVLASVLSRLDAAGIQYAVIGAAALAVRGVARSTFDLDLLTTDVRALDLDIWSPLSASGIRVTVRRGGADDPLAGVARAESAGDRTVDVVVGRGGWQQDVVVRAEPIEFEGVRLPVVRAADLILLKLYAGGSQDAWDIEQLLASGDRRRLADDVDRAISQLPGSARALWRRIGS